MTATEGKLKGARSKVVVPEAMELSRLPAEVAKLKSENETLATVHQLSSSIAGGAQNIRKNWLPETHLMAG